MHQSRVCHAPAITGNFENFHANDQCIPGPLRIVFKVRCIPASLMRSLTKLYERKWSRWSAFNRTHDRSIIQNCRRQTYFCGTISLFQCHIGSNPFCVEKLLKILGPNSTHIPTTRFDRCLGVVNELLSVSSALPDLTDLTERQPTRAEIHIRTNYAKCQRSAALDRSEAAKRKE